MTPEGRLLVFLLLTYFMSFSPVSSADFEQVFDAMDAQLRGLIETRKTLHRKIKNLILIFWYVLIK